MVYQGRRRSKRGGGRRRSESGGGMALTVCVWALFLALMARILFPEAVTGAVEKVKMVFAGEVDYAQAVRMVGDAMDSGTGFFDAVGRAWEYAFAAKDDDIQVSAGDGTSRFEEEHSTPVMNEGEGDGGDAAPTFSDSDGENRGEATDPGSPVADAVAAFKAGMEKYADLGVPKNVTYDMPELPLELTSPVSGTVTSGFGYREHPSDGKVRFHYGLDIGASEGTEVMAVAAGTVTAVGDSTSYGKYVIIRHEGGAESLYAHMSETLVENGSELQAGAVLGRVGSTGNATGPCLHLELLIDGNYVNPVYYIDV